MKQINETFETEITEAPSPHGDAPQPAHRLGALIMAALGIVFGDIGTSPLYTFKTVLDLSGGNLAPDAILGLLSLVVWTLLFTVSLKYVSFVMRADNGGEGGILALMSLLRQKKPNRPLIIAVGLFGAALIYGDGAITPAISVLSAIEGVKLADPQVAPYILPLSIGILLVLFSGQSQGTARIGWVFGPVMCVWFAVLGLLGLRGIAMHPGVIAALNPWHAFHYLLISGGTGFAVLGGVFLAVTGAEALYADMGHIGARAIRLAWYGLVLPALLLNYAGQAGLLLAGETAEDNLFYRLCPEHMLLPLIGLSTLATIIASQAIITGAFSMTRQMIQLGWCPRLEIKQTSSLGYGQIYVGAVNWMLMIATLWLTVAFGSSDNLAAAYGIAVSMTMLLTTSLMLIAMREVWRWSLALAVPISCGFFIVDGAFFAANSLKLAEGGWVPLVLAVAIYTLMTTWRRGSVAVMRGMRALMVPVDQFIKNLSGKGVPRVPGTAVFLSKSVDQTPPLLVFHVDHSRALHRHVIVMTMVTLPVPWVENAKRFTIESLAPNFWRLVAYYGFMERVDIPAVLRTVKQRGYPVDLSDVTYFIGRETVKHCANGAGLPQWQEALFAFMQKNSAQIGEYLSLPSESVVEIGRQVEI